MRVSGARVLPFLLTALLVAALLPTGSAVPDDPDNRWADIQGIAPGDWWDFRVSGQDNGDVHNVVVGVTNKENWFGKTVQTYRIDASGVLESRQRPRDVTGTGIQPQQDATVTVEFEVSKWVRTTDYAVHHVEGRTTVEGHRQSEPTVESFDPPFVETIFPFQEGYKWKTNAKWYQKRGSEEPIKDATMMGQVEVLGKERVTVPAGTFDAWKLQIIGGRDASEYKLQWYAEETCDLVKEERYGNDGALINTMELTAYDCARNAKENPTYDPKWVVLLAVGELAPSETPPTVFSPEVEANASGSGMWWVAGGLIVVAGGVMLVVKRRNA